jgi:hypothetical protein
VIARIDQRSRKKRGDGGDGRGVVDCEAGGVAVPRGWLGGRVDGAEVVEFFGGVVGVDVNGR